MCHPTPQCLERTLRTGDEGEGHQQSFERLEPAAAALPAKSPPFEEKEWSVEDAELFKHLIDNDYPIFVIKVCMHFYTAVAVMLVGVLVFVRLSPAIGRQPVRSKSP